MPNSLPFPVRVVAGLVATGLDTVRRIPGDLPGLGVEVAGALTRVGLRVQQQVSELAARGDEMLDGHPEPQEHPAWARFDDEDEAANAPDGADADPAGEDPARGGAEHRLDNGGGQPAPRARGDGQAARGGRGDEQPAGANHAGDHRDADAPLPGYQAMSLAQVRGHLRTLSMAQTRRLLESELAGQDRPAFVTLLRNRITTLEHAG